jgi:hypothetical protein
VANVNLSSRYAVVGAGFAGLSCSLELVTQGAAGSDIALFEGSNPQGAGGRAARRIIHSGMPCQGPTFIGDTGLKQRLEALGCPTVPLTRFFYQQGRVFQEDYGNGPASALKVVSEEACLGGVNVSVAAGLKASRTFHSLPKTQKLQLVAFLRNEFGAEPAKVGVIGLSAQGTVDQALDPHEFFGVCSYGGFHVLAEDIRDNIEQADVRLQWSQTLEAVQPEDSGITLVLRDRNAEHPVRFHVSESAFLGIPLDKLKGIHFETNGERDGLLLDHLDSSAKSTLNSLAMGSVIKVAVPIKRLLIEGAEVGNLLTDPSVHRSRVTCDEVWLLPPSSEVPEAKQTLLLYLAGDRVRSFYEKIRSREDLQQWIYDTCTGLLGLEKADVILQPDVAQWSPELRGGAYSYPIADGADLNRKPFDFSQCVLPRLFVGGEAVSPDQPGFVGGAIETGRSAGHQMYNERRNGHS